MMDANDSIEKELAGLTRWKGGSTALWRAAARTGRRPQGAAHGLRLLARYLTWGRIAITAVGGVVLIALVTNLPHLGLPVEVGRDRLVKTQAANLRGVGAGMYIYAQDDPQVFPDIDMWKIVRQNNVTPKAFNSPSTADVPDPAQDTTAYYDQAGPSDAKTPAYQYQRDPARTIVGTSSEPTISTNSESAESTGGRAVIQSGTIELISKDVSASFLKVQRLVRLEAGEYLENSYVSGDAQYMQANLTLRVAADRLDEVLNELRQIGKIVTEQIQGRDVTAEVVDVEARLRNERSIETELLELLDTRKDAPLKELLELRDALKNVRYTIESLDGRRATLAHMVSLASILVTIRPDSAPPPEAPIAYWQYFGEEMTSAWQQSIHFLARAFAVIVRIALGGLPLWALIAVVVLLVRRRGRAG